MWNFLKCLAISFFPAFCMFALLIVITGASTFRNDREKEIAVYFNIAVFIGIIVLLMYIAKTVNGMW